MSEQKDSPQVKAMEMEVKLIRLGFHGAKNVQINNEKFHKNGNTILVKVISEKIIHVAIIFHDTMDITSYYGVNNYSVMWEDLDSFLSEKERYFNNTL